MTNILNGKRYHKAMYTNYSKAESKIADHIIGYYDFQEDPYDQLDDKYHRKVKETFSNDELFFKTSHTLRDKFDRYNQLIWEIDIAVRDTTLHTDRPVNLELHHCETIYLNLEMKLRDVLFEHISVDYHSEAQDAFLLTYHDSMEVHRIQQCLKDIFENCIKTNS